MPWVERPHNLVLSKKICENLRNLRTIPIPILPIKPHKIPQNPMNPQNILIDTDLGDDVDDILAIAFALLRPELSVKAITAVSYDTGRRCHLIARLLSCLGRENVDFAPGMKLPLRPAAKHEIAHSIQPEGYILNQYPIVRDTDKSAPPSADAVELIARTVKENAGNITLAAIGPLTNIAVALQRYPEIATQISGIAIMGGEINLNRAEHNIAWDAAAAQIVFASGVPLFVGTWDVTRRFVLSPSDCEAIGRNTSPVCQLLHESIKLWWPHKAHKTSPVMYDIAPILWAFAPEYFTTESMELVVETRGENTRGFTVRGHGPHNAKVTTNMQADQIRRLYLDTLGVAAPA